LRRRDMDNPGHANGVAFERQRQSEVSHQADEDAVGDMARDREHDVAIKAAI
jgi:hypothetical protein